MIQVKVESHIRMFCEAVEDAVPQTPDLPFHNIAVCVYIYMYICMNMYVRMDVCIYIYTRRI